MRSIHIASTNSFNLIGKLWGRAQRNSWVAWAVLARVLRCSGGLSLQKTKTARRYITRQVAGKSSQNFTFAEVKNKSPVLVLVDKNFFRHQLLEGQSDNFQNF